jgi:hypothetical protein
MRRANKSRALLGEVMEQQQNRGRAVRREIAPPLGFEQDKLPTPGEELEGTSHSGWRRWRVPTASEVRGLRGARPHVGRSHPMWRYRAPPRHPCCRTCLAPFDAAIATGEVTIVFCEPGPSCPCHIACQPVPPHQTYLTATRARSAPGRRLLRVL